MYLKDFNYLRPKSLTEACRMLQDSNSTIIAGGTDLLVEMKTGNRHHDNIISVADIDELKNITEDQKHIIIGSAVTHSEIVNSELLKKNYYVLQEASENVGTEQIRNTATIGGNICTGASCCDTGPALLASDCILELVNTNGKREISIQDFFLFHRKTAVKQNEILTKIKIPKLKKGTGICIEKFGLRNAASISVASAVSYITIENGICKDARIVVGAVAPTPIICTEAANILIGEKTENLTADSEILEKSGSAAMQDSSPICDIRGTVEYRQHLIKTLVKRTIKKATKRAIKNNNL